jgi:hypothetical protein
MLISLYVVTIGRVFVMRTRGTTEASLELSAEAVWGMIAFATLPVIASCGALLAAWQAGRLPATAPWDGVDVDKVGGDA